MWGGHTSEAERQHGAAHWIKDDVPVVVNRETHDDGNDRQPGKHERRACEPLDLLAFLERRPAIADHQGDRGQHGAGEVDELAEEAERRDAGHLACDADNRACERDPGERPPAWRDRLTIGEKEGQEKEREDHRRDPYPAGQPLPKIRVGNGWVWGVGDVAGEAQDEFFEPPQDADPAAYPPDPVPWPPPDDQCADDGEGHREDRGQPKVLLGGTRQWREVGVGGVTEVGSCAAENNRGHRERPAKPDPDSCRMGVRHRGHRTPPGQAETRQAGRSARRSWPTPR